MKRILICGLWALTMARGFCGDGDDMLITQWTKDKLAWTNSLPGSTCSVQIASTLTSAGGWTDLLSGVVATSTVTAVALPMLPEGTGFLRAARPFVPTLGLVAHYRFEGDARDASLEANHGTNNGVVFEAGQNGLCARFNGSGAHIRVPQSPSLKLTSAMSICAWIKPLAIDGLRCIVDKDNGYIGYNLYVNGGAGCMRICGSVVWQAGTITNGGWQHVAGVFTGNKIRVFVGGVQRGEVASGSLVDRADKDVFIGMWGPPGGPARYFSGWMDEVRIYARAVTPAEIELLAAGGL